MRTRVPKARSIRNKTITLTGGLNEQVSSPELEPGELFECYNYEEADGQYAGYRSTAGFERWDGTVIEYEYPLGSGDYKDVRYPSDVPVLKDSNGIPIDTIEYIESLNVLAEDDRQVLSENDLDLVTEDYYDDHSEREARRLQITPVPGYGNILFCDYYNGTLYAIRGAVDESSGLQSDYTKLWEMYEGTDAITDPGGWVEVTEWPVDILINDVYESPYRSVECQLAYWPSEHPNKESLCFTNGVSDAIMLYRHTDGSHIVETVVDEHLPDSGVNHPTIPIFFENRLFLAYPDGHIFFSELGKITYNPVFFAGEYYVGWEITDMVISPGSAIVVWTVKGIRILKKIEMAGDILSPVRVDTFSDRSSSIPKTATRFLGTMLFADDRGVTTMDTSEAFGDFKAASISKRVQNTYQTNKNNILTAIANREKNQYIVLYKSGDGLVFTFDIEKKVKSCTYFNMAKIFTYVSYGKNSSGNDVTIGGDRNGFIHFFRDEAQSFDGNYINTRFSTAFHGYGSQVVRKQFRKITCECSAQKGTQFRVKCDYDYHDVLQPKGETQYPVAKGTGSAWSDTEWGAFEWAGGLVELANIYLMGYGVNMSLILASSGKSHAPHTLHNFTTNYSKSNLQQ